MVTMVGKHDDAVGALNDLLELEFDAIAAYELSIERFEQAQNKAKLTEFVGDHRKHVTAITALVTALGGTPATKGDAKEMLTTGKIKIADMIGDDMTILKAMITNEMETVMAYENMWKRDDLSADAKKVMEQGLADERKHKLWMESAVGNEKRLAS